ncbi:MAG: hypothetical protein EXS14_10580, partial [Planctomycetes bacterium]|nr:hypothetical protein [Planctomycetota bacterium]
MRRALMILMVLVPWTMAQESVVFVRETPEQRHGALVLLERGRERVLVEDRVSMPCLAPDARSVAFLDHSGAETYPKLTLLEIESGTRRTLATRMPPQAVRYSPDSRTLLFAGWEESMLAEIYTVPCTGGTPKRLTSTTGRSPVFSPDGAWIAYMAFGEGGHDGLCEMRADGTEWRRLAPARARDSRPDFSHDGRWLVCQDYEDADDKALRGVVWLIDRQGGTPRR